MKKSVFYVSKSIQNILNRLKVYFRYYFITIRVQLGKSIHKKSTKVVETNFNLGNDGCLFLTALKLGRVDAIKHFLNHEDTKSKQSEQIIQKAIFLCIRKYDVKPCYSPILVNIIKKTKISLDFEDHECSPPLQLAVRKQNVKLVKIILNGKVDVNYKNSKNGKFPNLVNSNFLENTALHSAALINNEELVRLLLANKASVVVQNSKKMVPNGFTTNMNIIKLLNKKASEYENKAMKKMNRKRKDVSSSYPQAYANCRLDCNERNQRSSVPLFIESSNQTPSKKYEY